MSLRDYLWIALVAAMALGAWKLHHDGYASGVAHQVAITAQQDAKAAAEAQKRTIVADAGAKAATDAGQVKIAQNEAATHETVRVITRVVHDHPANPVCRVPADSLQALQRAADAANAAASQLPIAGTK